MFVYLSLGSNQGDRIANLKQAIKSLSTIMDVQRESTIYESAPLYVTDQPYFLNMAVMGETTMAPHELLKALKAIEAEMGRDLTPDAQHYGPRPIDIDILLITTVIATRGPKDYIIVNDPELTVPHPRMTERAFVLRPMLGICGNAFLIQPLLNVDLLDFLSDVSEQDIQELGPLAKAEKVLAVQSTESQHLRRIRSVSARILRQKTAEDSMDQYIVTIINKSDYHKVDASATIKSFRSRYGRTQTLILLEKILQELRNPTRVLLIQGSRIALIPFFEDMLNQHKTMFDPYQN